MLSSEKSGRGHVSSKSIITDWLTASAVSPTTVNDADMNNLCLCARQREKTGALGACVVLSAGCVLTDEVTPSSLIMQRLVRVRESLSRSVLLFVRVWEQRRGDTKIKLQCTFNVKHTFPPSLGYFPLFAAACFIFAPHF